MPLRNKNEIMQLWLQFKNDPEAQRQVEKDLDSIITKIGLLEKEMGALSDVSPGQGVEELQGQIDELSKELETYLGIGIQVGEAMREQEDAAQALRKEITELSKSSEALGRIGRGFGVVGGGILAAVSGSAALYIKAVKDSGVQTELVANRWEAAMARVQNASLVAGKVSAEALLPSLEKGAELAERIASIIEKNPDLVVNAVKLGTTLVALSAVASLASKGIKLFADLKTLNLLDGNTKAMKALAKGLQTFGGAKGLLGGAAALGIGVAISYVIIEALNKWMDTTGLGDTIRSAQKKAFDVGEASGRRAYPGYNQFADAAEDAERAAKKAAPAITDLAGALERAAKEAQGAQILADLAKDLASMEQEYARDREKIARTTNDRLAEIGRKTSSALVKAAEDYQDRIADKYKAYHKDSASAESDYETKRANIIRNSSKDIQRIETDLQEALRKLRLEHSDRVYELVAARDALGLVRERRRYDRERSEREREATLKIREQRQETAQELEENRRTYELKKAQRLQQLEQDLEEEAARYEEQRQELIQRRAEEIAELLRAKAIELRELQIAYRNETRAKITEAYESIRALGGALNAERTLKQTYYKYMLDDAASFMSGFRSTLGGKGNITGSTGFSSRAEGGYAGYGAYLLGDSKGGGPGGREFVLDAATTRNAESLMKGNLTQRGLLTALQGGDRTNINLTLPGGLVTIPMMKDILRENNGNFLETLSRYLEV